VEPAGDPRNELQVLELLDALVTALDRHAEVGETIASSADAQEAVRRLQDLLGVSETAAIEVLNVQWHRWTRNGRTELRARRDELLARRDDLLARRDAMGQTD
jgi:DNA gyrase/topoisomerase IV subunit A